MNTSCRIIISGRVQGVFFRESAATEAKRLGITGWVRNREDGTLEIVAEGRENKMRAFTEWCRKGPPLAKVERVDVQHRTFGGEFRSFEVVGKD